MSEGPSKLVRNEQLKLRASALNGVAIAMIVAGFVTPLAAATFGVLPPSARSAFVTALAALAWLLAGAAIHFLASRLLGGLQE